MMSERMMFLENWESFHKGVRKLAEIMDEKDYGFKPTPEMFSFKELLFHIVVSESGFLDGILTGNWRWDKYKPDQYKTKAEVINLINDVHSQSIKTIQNMTDEQLKKTTKTPWGLELPAIGLLWGMRDHMIHHRGQLFVYVRLKGLKPPPFIEMH
jgi:uncharacterized damage-inducible protein DinB